MFPAKFHPDSTIGRVVIRFTDSKLLNVKAFFLTCWWVATEKFKKEINF